MIVRLELPGELLRALAAVLEWLLTDPGCQAALRAARAELPPAAAEPPPPPQPQLPPAPARAHLEPAPPQPPSPAPPRLIQRKAGHWCTPERRAMLHRDWPAGVPVRDLARLLAALPGPELPSLPDIAVYAATLGLRRPPGFKRGHAPGAPSIQAPMPPSGLPVAAAATPIALCSRDGAPSIQALMPPSGLPVAVAAMPIALRSRDGAPSLAARLDAAEVAAVLAPITAAFAEVAAYAAANRIVAEPWDLLRQVNARRHAWGLPRFHVPLQELPGRPIVRAAPDA